MATYSIDTIKRDARVILGENENITPLLTEQSGESFDDWLSSERDTIIGDLICKAIDRVHTFASSDMVRDAAVSPSSGTTQDTYCTRYKLGQSYSGGEFLRLCSVKLPKWRVAVHTLTAANSEEYTQAQSPIAIMRPNERHPIVSLAEKNGLALECYPGDSTATGTSCLVVNKAVVSSSSVQCSQDCYNAMLYALAALYYTSIDERERAETMEKEMEKMLGLNE